MLLKLRSGQNNFLVTILLGLLIASFALVSGGGSFFGSSSAIVATVGDSDVLTNEYNQRVTQQAQQYQIQLGGEKTSQEIIRDFNLDQIVLGQMMARASFVQAAKDLGLRSTRKQIAKNLADTPAFKFGGAFSKNAMEEALRSSGLTARRYEELIGEDMATQQLITAISAPRPELTRLAAYLYAHDTERRTADLISFSAASINDIDDPSEEQLLELYNANKDTFMEPERRSYRYILLTPERFIDEIEISEEAIAAEYEASLYDYVTPETRSVDQAVFTSAEQADVFLARIRGGEDFIKVAAEMTDFTEGEISLGLMDKRAAGTDLGDTSAEAIFDLVPNTPSDAIETPFGYNVFRVTAITAGSEKTLADVRGEIKSKLSKDQAVDKLYDLLPAIEDSISLDNSLEAAAEKVGLTLAVVNSADASGLRSDGSQLISSQSEMRILFDAFSMQMGDPVEVKNLNPQDSNDGMYFIELSDVAEATVKPYEEVAAKVRSQWRMQARMNKAGEIAEQALARLKDGDAAEDVADDLDGASFQAKNVSRTASQASAGISANIRSLIFSLGEGESDIDRTSDNAGYMVVQLKTIKAPAIDPESFEVAAMAGQIQGQIAQEIQQQYQAALWNRYDRTQNNIVIRQLFDSDL